MGHTLNLSIIIAKFPRPVLWFGAGVLGSVLLARSLPNEAFRIGRLFEASNIAHADSIPFAVAGKPALPKTPGLVMLSDPRQVAQIETTVAVASPLPITQTLAGRLAYDENATSRLTVPVDGRVLKLVRQVGDTVAVGEPIIELDSPDLGQALADSAKSRADMALKRASLARAEDLFANQVLAKKDLDVARAEQAQSTAEFDRTELRLKNLNARGRVRGQTFVLASPIAGVLTERNATIGQQMLAASGNVLATVTDPAHLMLVIDAPEADADRLAVGMAIEFTVDAAPNERFHAKLVRISPQLDPNTRRVQLRASVENPNGKLRPEMFARALPTTDASKTVTSLPSSALLQFGAHTIVFVSRDDGRFEQREVAVLVQQGTDVWLRNGIMAGEKVVTAGALLLKSELVGQ